MISKTISKSFKVTEMAFLTDWMNITSKVFKSQISLSVSSKHSTEETRSQVELIAFGKKDFRKKNKLRFIAFFETLGTGDGTIYDTLSTHTTNNTAVSKACIKDVESLNRKLTPENS